MKTFFGNYPQATLAIIAVVLLLIIVSYFTWGIGDIVMEVNRSVDASVASGTNPGFNLKGAQDLNLPTLAKPLP